MCLIYRLVYLQAQDSKGINPTSSKLCKNALLNSPVSKTPLFRQNKHFLVTSFLRYIRSSKSGACGGLRLPPWGGTKGPICAKFFTPFFTHNFDISISDRDLTLYTIQIHIFRPLDFTHINNILKKISVNYNGAPELFAKHSSFQYKL